MAIYRIMGIDPSMRSTGIYINDPQEKMYFLICSAPTKKALKVRHPNFKMITYEPVPVKGKTAIGQEMAKTDNVRRISIIIGQLLDEYRPDLVILEAVAMAANGRLDELSGLSYVIRMECMNRDIPVRAVPPTSNKLAFTGNGQATKEMMVNSWKACDPISDDLKDLGKGLEDLADAYSLSFYPMESLGISGPCNP